ncbi:Fe2+-dependent dioxygenase [Lysobacter sp. TY2-98]|uniref:Fe2+-dependent dioxygenase n=1 Tax=Lysobacter sp. TY2-98 TaxID=2290922 RepID=UPI000E205650|nr:Fe2+-dependent dioxygenase [Lysobacter sp. TY2-98]AXK71422.1 Fe2+-dependent dioxygenase [Lysobacter sp. TY2-98]
MLLHVPGVLDGDTLAQMRRALVEADWTDGRATVGPQGAQVKRNEQLPDTSPLRQRLAALVLDAVSRNPLFHAATLPARIFPPRFNRYRGGGEYGFHVDGAVMSVDGAPSQPIRSDISCTLFLNEPEDYDGGELIIHDTYGEHEVKLAAGDAIVYPSSSLHRVTPVTRGERLASFFWIQSLVRDDSQRRTLFELDSSIQTLTATGADRESLLRLTGIYHNLLRRWAET